MFNILLLVPAFIVLTTATNVSLKEEWSNFKSRYNKLYLIPREDNFRMSVFLDTLKMIEEHNARYREGKVSYSMKMNRFGDQLMDEIKEKWRGFTKAGGGILESHYTPENTTAPVSMDWRQRGAVTPVKDEGDCGCGWAFSATGALEGQLYFQKKRLISLSEQQLVDCSRDFGNAGCSGGLADNAFFYIWEEGSHAEEEEYPYRGQEEMCWYFPKETADSPSIKGYVSLPPGVEEALKLAVATVGPVSVAVSASVWEFIFYGEGILTSDYCNFERPEQGLLIVGYGTEKGEDFWILKNSWGQEWGEDGYVRLARNKDNILGVASWASYPVY